MYSVRPAIPGVRPGETGSYSPVWGTLFVGNEDYDGNAAYLRRNVIGLPEGTGIGHVLTTSVNLTRYDNERVEGTFDGRFLDERRYQAMDILEQHPLGVGVHYFPQAEIRASGEFSVVLDQSCRTRAAVRRMGR